jgi:hypothetical protein
MFFHFDFANYFRMLRSPGTRRIRARAAPTGQAPALGAAVAAFHAFCFSLDALLFPGCTALRSAPGLRVGHARSGTTLVHR